MKKAFTYFFVTLGVIFLVLIVFGGYFFVTDPYNLKPLLISYVETTLQEGVSSTSELSSITAVGSAASGFNLSAEQKDALINLGIDPVAVPNTITSGQEDCFVSVFGESRVTEIKAGAVPNAIEFLRAKDCI